MRPAGERQSAARALHQRSKEKNKTSSGPNASTNGMAAPARRTWRGPMPFSPRPKHTGLQLRPWARTRASACHIAMLVLHTAVRRVFQDIRAKSLNSGHCKKNQQIALQRSDTVRTTGSRRGSRLSQQVVFAAGAFAAKSTSKQRILPQASSTWPPSLFWRMGSPYPPPHPP